MKNLEELKSELNAMYESYKANPMPTFTKEYHTFYKKYQSLQSKIKNYNSASNQIKRAGCKVTKTSAGYMFHGNSGLKVEIWADACETKFWSAQFVEGTVLQEEEINWTSTFDTKKDALIYLLELDKK